MDHSIAIVFSSRHGHVEKIARKMRDICITRGADVVLINARTVVTIDHVDSAIFIGSVHFGRHSRSLRRFVLHNRTRLSAIPSAFISVSGAAASIQGRATAQQYMNDFVRVTGWRPDLSISVAGAILFTKYSPLTRKAMMFAARIAGRDSDPSRDYDYTDWFAVDGFAHDFVDLLDRHSRIAASSRQPLAAAGA